MFTTHFTNSKVEFTRRQANEVAHILTGAVTLSASPIAYYHVPRCIKQVFNHEMLKASFFQNKVMTRDNVMF